MSKIWALCMKCAFHWRAKKTKDVRCPRCGLLGEIRVEHPDIETTLRCKPFIGRKVQ